MDDNKDRKLSFEEFTKGITEYGFSYTKDEMKEIFIIFDKDHSGSIDFDEFLLKLRVKIVFDFFVFYDALINFS
jgi:calcyphosin